MTAKAGLHQDLVEFDIAVAKLRNHGWTEQSAHERVKLGFADEDHVSSASLADGETKLTVSSDQTADVSPSVPLRGQGANSAMPKGQKTRAPVRDPSPSPINIAARAAAKKAIFTAVNRKTADGT
jgi:hypothetical protein